MGRLASSIVVTVDEFLVWQKWQERGILLYLTAGRSSVIATSIGCRLLAFNPVAVSFFGLVVMYGAL